MTNAKLSKTGKSHKFQMRIAIVLQISIPQQIRMDYTIGILHFSQFFHYKP